MADIDTDGDKNFTFLSYEKERMDDFECGAAGRDLGRPRRWTTGAGSGNACLREANQEGQACGGSKARSVRRGGHDMKAASALLQSAVSMGLYLWADGDQLRYKATHAVSEGMKARIREHRRDIITLLGSKAALPQWWLAKPPKSLRLGRFLQ